MTSDQPASSAPLALLSVSDKAGIEDLGRALVDAGYELLSTGGTARRLAAAGLPVTKVGDFTGHPEVMDGRVKTLHPRVHGGILGLRGTHDEEARRHDIRWIDVVACNLYPFEATVAQEGVTVPEAVEQIDIGGPTMVRAAAKNHAHVAVITDPGDYAEVARGLAQGGLSPALRRRLAVKAFRHTAAYDGLIARWLGDSLQQEGEGAAEGAAEGGAAGQRRPELPEETGLALRKVQPLRYGENPHQRAAFYADPGAGGRALGRARKLQGKSLSFNNLGDLDGALRAVFEFEEPACVVVKHMNPCGAAVHAEGPARCFELALSADPVSAYGGIVVFNRPVDGDTVRAFRRARTFFEVLAAPGFSEEARELLAPREKLRVLELPADWLASRPEGFDARRVQGGWLLQDWDVGAPMGWEVASARSPDDDEAAALRFAWKVCRSVKSNAIVLARAEAGGFVLNGVGAGQMSRVDSARIAVQKARREVAGSVLASDAFFPFPDAVEEALAAGVRAVIQPGGSIRDEAVTAAVDAAGAAMVFTGHRHFRH